MRPSSILVLAVLLLVVVIAGFTSLTVSMSRESGSGINSMKSSSMLSDSSKSSYQRQESN